MVVSATPLTYVIPRRGNAKMFHLRPAFATTVSTSTIISALAASIITSSQVTTVVSSSSSSSSSFSSSGETSTGPRFSRTRHHPHPNPPPPPPPPPLDPPLCHPFCYDNTKQITGTRQSRSLSPDPSLCPSCHHDYTKHTDASTSELTGVTGTRW